MTMLRMRSGALFRVSGEYVEDTLVADLQSCQGNDQANLLGVMCM